MQKYCILIITEVGQTDKSKLKTILRRSVIVAVWALGILSPDIMSIYFGACNTPFGKFILASVFGLLPRIIGDPIIGRKTINPASPELAVKGSLEKVEAEGMLARLNELAITAIPKFDFSAAHDAWLGNYSKMPDTCAYREFVKKILTKSANFSTIPNIFTCVWATKRWNIKNTTD